MPSVDRVNFGRVCWDPNKHDANTIYSAHVGLLLGHRLRRCPNNNPPWAEYIVFSGILGQISVYRHNRAFDHEVSSIIRHHCSLINPCPARAV